MVPKLPENGCSSPWTRVLVQICAKRTQKTERKYYDGIAGSKTREVIERTVREGKIQAVTDAMVDKRTELMKNLPEYKDNPGWLPRAESFRIGNPKKQP